MDAIIEKSLSNSYTYQDYRAYVTALAKEGKTTGNEQTEDHVHYTELNEARIKRLEKTIHVVGETKVFLDNLDREYLWLVIAESWCGDVVQVLPVIQKMAEQSEKIDLKIVLRDKNEDLMSLFLTNGTRSIPKLIIIDKKTKEVVGDFGPRPQGARQLILDYKATHGIVDETAKTNLQLWYFHDKGVSIQKEILEIMSTLVV